MNKKLLSSAKRSTNRKQLAEPDVVLGETLFLRLESKFYWLDWIGLDYLQNGEGYMPWHLNALNYIKDENNDLLDILFDHLVFI